MPVRWRGWVSLWVVTLVAGELLVARFDSRPGAAGASPASWPPSTTIARAADRAELLVFLHPFCPCSRATLTELERVLASDGRRADVQLVVSWPQEALPRDSGSLVERARSVAGARVVLDLGAREAARFGARTSGLVLLYDASGRLRFEGGITGSRGHEGDNAGEDALLSALRDSGGERRASPVYGCPLLGAPAAACDPSGTVMGAAR